MVSIGELSGQTGVSTQTIRYYERIKLLPVPKRADNSYRVYDESDVERLRFVNRARQLEFALEDIAEILAFRDQNEPPCKYVMNVMAQQIAVIEERIADLQHLRDELETLHRVGLTMPEDIEMKQCVCHLITTGLRARDEYDG
ncbi:MAG: heavy metal-responsive transcriptional regulator [Chloroflexi bacterium]|nr:heavy metal-responsive transcriptional regulator [Chloroflexota bacterium]